jgi:DDE_Tnp_1-associated
MIQTDGRDHAPDGSLRAALERLPDVRGGQGKVHPLGGMVALAVCAVVCGCRSLYAISQWGRECDPAIRVLLGRRAERGPRVATRHRAFRRLDHVAFEQVRGDWFAAQGLQPDEALAIDGKTLRGLPGGGDSRSPSGGGLRAPDAHQTRTRRASCWLRRRQWATGTKRARTGRGPSPLGGAASPAPRRASGDWRCAAGDTRAVSADRTKRGH